MLANKLLFLGSIGLAPLTVLAQNDCTSRLISCSAFPINGEFDYELVYDRIPDGSISSICQNTINAFQSAGLGTPGCQKLNNGNSDFNVPATSNLVAFSTRVSGAANFDPLTQTFENVLQCEISEVAPCFTLDPPSGSSRHRMIKKQTSLDILQNGGLMSQVGNQLQVAGGAGVLTLKIIKAVENELPFPPITNSNDVATAVQQMVRSILLALAGGSTALEPFEAPIGATGQVLKVVIDPAIGALTQAQAAAFAASDWQVLIGGLIDNAADTLTGLVSGVYSLSDTVTRLDLFITVVVGLLK